jgi:hypothetical protein
MRGVSNFELPPVQESVLAGNVKDFIGATREFEQFTSSRRKRRTSPPPPRSREPEVPKFEGFTPVPPVPGATRFVEIDGLPRPFRVAADKATRGVDLQTRTEFEQFTSSRRKRRTSPPPPRPREPEVPKFEGFTPVPPVPGATRFVEIDGLPRPFRVAADKARNFRFS